MGKVIANLDDCIMEDSSAIVVGYENLDILLDRYVQKNKREWEDAGATVPLAPEVIRIYNYLNNNQNLEFDLEEDHISLADEVEELPLLGMILKVTVSTEKSIFI